MTRASSCAILILAGLLAASPALAVNQSVSGQVRQFNTHHAFSERPFAYGDVGGGLSYEIRDEMGYWQIGALYTPEPGTSKDNLDYAVTPFLNLVFKESIILAGVGLDQTLSSGPEVSNEWTDLYWNFLAGIEYPVGKSLSLTGLALYDFKGWHTLNDFEAEDIEFAAAVNLLF